jgi:hypothetical protein
VQDLRHGLRTMIANPGFSVIAILSLALGIGANTAIFQLLNAVRPRSLPIRSPHELAEIKIAGGNGGMRIQDAYGELTRPMWEEIRRDHPAFSGVFAWRPERDGARRLRQRRFLPRSGSRAVSRTVPRARRRAHVSRLDGRRQPHVLAKQARRPPDRRQHQTPDRQQAEASSASRRQLPPEVAVDSVKRHIGEKHPEIVVFA